MFPDYYPELFITKRKYEYNDISEDEITVYPILGFDRYKIINNIFKIELYRS